MDIHPLIVHFPIALLTLYAVFELIRFNKVLEKPYWFYIKAALVIVGELLALLTILFSPEDGEMRIVEVHESFATATAIVFGLIALNYLIHWMKREGWFIRIPTLPNWSLVILAVIGLVCITITGGLGGAIVYGTEFDPLMAPIFKLLGVY